MSSKPHRKEIGCAIIPAMAYEPGAELSAIRRRIDHPIIDGDGHIIEYLPLVRDILVEIGGRVLAKIGRAHV